MKLLTTDPICASRRNQRVAVKNKLFIKYFSGPQMGRLSASKGDLTGDLNEALMQITLALMRSGARVNSQTFKLRLRRFAPNGPFADGVFIVDRKVFGVVLYGPEELTAAAVDQFMFQHVNAIPFFIAHRDGDVERLLTEPILPDYPELPEPIEDLWPTVATAAPVQEGGG